MDYKRTANNTGLFFMAIFAVFIGLYPLRFIGLAYEDGILGSKPAELISNNLYLLVFYCHISFGGLALFSGFSQFFKKLRVKLLSLHRTLGKIYIFSVLLSGTAGLCIAYFATGGMVPMLGFGLLAILWLYTTVNAYRAIRRRDIDVHQRWMIRSYALCFAAVTLRIYLGAFTAAGMDFLSAYKIISWLCWVPNFLVAEFLIIQRLKTV